MSEVVDKIKENGYWRVKIQPIHSFNEDRFTIPELEKAISDAQVRLRGWYFPHMNREGKADVIGQNKIGDSCEFDEIKEYWEAHTSGVFAHLFGMREDNGLIIPEKIEGIKARLLPRVSNTKVDNVSKFLEIVSAVYYITEIYYFAAGFCQHHKFADISEFEITIELHGVKDRMLFMWDQLRILFEPYICAREDDKIILTGKYKKADLIAKFDSLALDKIIETFIYFGWREPNKQVLAGDQKKLLERRL